MQLINPSAFRLQRVCLLSSHNYPYRLLADVRVGKSLNDLKLTGSRKLEALAVFFGGGLSNGILTYPAKYIVERSVLGKTVLIPRAIENQVPENVVAHSPGALGGADARLFHRPRKPLGEFNVDGAQQFVVNSGTFPIIEGCKNSLPLRFGICLGPVFEQYSIAAFPVKSHWSSSPERKTRASSHGRRTLVRAA